MRRIFFLLSLIFCTDIALGQAWGGSQACIWQGPLANCLPSTGITLPNQRVVRFGELSTNGANYVALTAPAALSGDFTATLFAATDTVVGEAAAATLTNKTMSGSSNTFTNLPAATGLTGAVPIANGGTGAATKAAGFDALSPLTTAGDLLYGGTGGTGTRLAAGTTGQILISGTTPSWLAAGTSSQFLKGGTTPSWSAVDVSTAQVTGILPLANGGTAKNNTAAAGAVAYSDASGILLSAVGTNGMAFKSTGTTAPAFSWGSIQSSAADYTVTTTDGYSQTILTGTVSHSRTLPAASSSTGRSITFTNLGTGTPNAVMTITRAGSDTIGPLSETSILLSFTGDSITLVSDGTNWQFVGGYYQSAAQASVTFTFNGTGSPGTSSSKTVYYARRGQYVEIMVPLTTATSGTGSSSFLSDITGGSTALPAWATPTANTQYAGLNTIRNGGSATNAGIIGVTSAGRIRAQRDYAGSAWGTAASDCGFDYVTWTYYVGTGS